MSPLRYDDDSLFGAARNSDPATAQDAAKSMTAPILSDQRARVLRIVHLLCDATAYDVAVHAIDHPVQQNVAARRLRDLAEMGFVEATGGTRPGSSSRECAVYRVTYAGREALR